MHAFRLFCLKRLKMRIEIHNRRETRIQKLLRDRSNWRSDFSHSILIRIIFCPPFKYAREIRIEARVAM